MIWGMVEVVASAVENIIIVDFIGKYLGYKNEKMIWLKSCLFFALSMINVIVVPAVFNSEIASATILVLLLLGYSIAFLKENIYNKVFIVFFNVLIILTINTLMLTVFGWIFNADFNNLAQMRNSARVMLLVTTKFLYFICTRLILKLKKGKGYSLSGKEWLMVLCIFFVTLTIGIMMFEAIWKEDYNDTVLSMFAFGLIFINVITYSLLSRLSRDNVRKTELAILEIQLHEQAERMNEINNMYSEVLQIRHDIKKCVNCAGVLLKQGKYSEAENYLNEIYSERLGTIKEYVVLKSGVVSAVINSKLSECKRKNISIETSISECTEGFSEIDISILLANLLDNAIEACMKLNEGRFLSFHMFLYMGYLRIVMKNSVDSSNAGNIRFTTKPDRKNHGFGIKTITEISEKYNGMHDFRFVGNEFIADIWLKKK